MNFPGFVFYAFSHNLGSFIAYFCILKDKVFTKLKT